MNEKERRLELQTKLETVVANVYFQPPETMKLKFPCIVYFKVSPDVRHANNKVYNYKQCYTLTVVDKDPDSSIPEEILNGFKYTRIDSYYRQDNLNHTKLTLYY